MMFGWEGAKALVESWAHPHALHLAHVLVKEFLCSGGMFATSLWASNPKTKLM